MGLDVPVVGRCLLRPLQRLMPCLKPLLAFETKTEPKACLGNTRDPGIPDLLV